MRTWVVPVWGPWTLYTYYDSPRSNHWNREGRYWSVKARSAARAVDLVKLKSGLEIRGKAFTEHPNHP